MRRHRRLRTPRSRGIPPTPAHSVNWKTLGGIAVGIGALALLKKRTNASTVPARAEGRPVGQYLLFGLGAIADVLRTTDRGGIELPSPPAQVPQPATPSSRPPTLDKAEIFAALELGHSQSTLTWKPPSDARWLELAPHPAVILIIGKRGSGKSALGYRLLELYRDRAAPYVVGLPASGRKMLPDWVGVMDQLEDVPPGAAILLDEAYIRLHARNSMSKAGRDIGTMVNLSRQRRQTLVFVVQEARQLDVNAISQADVIAVKDLSELSREFERKELRAFTDKARVAFSAVVGDRRRWTWVYAETTDEAGMVENSLASFWKPALSRVFGDAMTPAAKPGGARRKPTQRKGTRTPRQVLAERARVMRAAGHSYGQIAKTLGVSKTTAYEMVNGRRSTHDPTHRPL